MGGVGHLHASEVDIAVVADWGCTHVDVVSMPKAGHKLEGGSIDLINISTIPKLLRIENCTTA